MLKLFKKNKAIAVFIINSVVLYIHELYRLSLGCPRVLGECYIDGADRFIFISFFSQNLIFVCLIIFFYRLLRSLYIFFKPKREITGPCGGPIPEDLLGPIKKQLKRKIKNENKRVNS
jgi:hypothetical protein